MDSPQPTRFTKLPRLQPRSGIKVMYAAIRALLLRELQTRFGHYRLGYLWVFLEPLLTIGFKLVVLGSIMQKTLPGISYEIFLVNGILPFFMFRSGLSQALTATQSNKGLLSYRPVKPIDTVLARTLLEFFLKFIAYLFFSLVFLWLGQFISFEAIPQLLACWLLLFVFTVGGSLLFAVIGDFSKEIGKFMSACFVILFFISGVFYSIHIVPPQYLEFFLYNPLVHIFESMRHAVAPTYPLVNGITLTYPIMWTIGTLFIGLLVYKSFEERMVKSK